MAYKIIGGITYQCDNKGNPIIETSKQVPAISYGETTSHFYRRVKEWEQETGFNFLEVRKLVNNTDSFPMTEQDIADFLSGEVINTPDENLYTESHVLSLLKSLGYPNIKKLLYGRD